MSMAPYPPTIDIGPAVHQQRIEAQLQNLLRVQKAVQRISSILDLEALLDELVNNLAVSFGFLESNILLKDGDDLVVTAIRGCTIHHKGFKFGIGRMGLVGHCGATGNVIYTPDVRLEPRYIACEE